MDTYNVKRYSDLKTIKCRNGGAYVCFQNNCLLKIGNYKYRIFYVSLMVITQVNLQYILKKKKKIKRKESKRTTTENPQITKEESKTGKTGTRIIKQSENN